jgi:hypothetical protein
MRLMILLFFTFTAWNSFGQKFLQIEKYGKTKVLKFYVGDKLTYQIKGDKKTWYKGTINDLLVDDNIIVFENRAVKMKDITVIRTFKNAGLSRSLSFQLYAFAAGFGAFSVVATLIGWWQLSALTAIVVGSAFVAGLLVRHIFKWKTHKMGKRNWLRMLDLTMKPVLGP